MTVAGQPTVNYTYDNVNRLTQITQGGSTVTIAYDAIGRRTSLTLPNGVVTEYGYDNASQLTSLTYKQGTTTLGDLTYDYDAAGRRTSMGGSFARSLTPQGVGAANYNAGNQQLGFGSQTLTYDLNGNLLSDGANSYTWDARDRLVSMTGPGVNASFQYDARGRRSNKTVNGTTTSFLYDGLNIVQELDGSSDTHMLTGGLDEVFLRTSGASTSSLLQDGLGSLVSSTDSNGALQGEYTYGAFGATATTGETNGNSSQYTGRENDGTGLYYYRARYYSPALQRFVSEDPIRLHGGINFYAYVNNNPVNYVDPLGEATLQVGIAGSYIAGIVSGNASIGLCIDGSGNVGWYWEAGGGGGLGAGGAVGVAVHGSNAQDITDLGGPFNNGSVGAGDGLDASLDGFVGNSPHGR
ncbi:MAG TPA: RHS repeat-associated core domain-containing protein [Pyrinomonadaceae bacterium]|nr:RHS repeat-associated core domain-containing protein [Pyrinomonadaceae bacterium]